MKKTLFIIVLFTFLSSTIIFAQDKERAFTSAIDSIVNYGIQNKAYPGAQVYLFKKGHLDYHQTYGYHTYESLVPVKKSDLYDLASVTKVLAATLAFMKLYETYKLNLDAKISDYLPALKRGNKKNTTFREVLSHSAGWLSYLAHQNTVRKNNGAFKARTLRHSASKRYAIQISDSLFVHHNYRKKIMRRIKKTKVSDPGTYLYSGLWFFLIPQLTEQLSGLSFEHFLATHFYQPLQLERLTFLPATIFPKGEIVPTEYDAFFRKQLVQGWVHDEAAALMGGISGNAGLFANATSIAPLLEMLLNNGNYKGKKILDPQTIALFTQKAYPKSQNRRGLGFDKPELKSEEEPYPSLLVSPASFGHTGFTGTLIWIDPEQESFLIFLSNRVYPSRDQRGLYQLNIRSKLLDNVLAY